MAHQGDLKLLFCIFFVICCSTATLSQIAIDCCLSVSNKEIDKRLIVDYSEQPRGCSIGATILVTRLGKQLCAPTKDEQWVQNTIKHVDHLKQKCKKGNYKGRRCFGVKHE
ncbi:C-C motif chemokine 18 [Fundulus heteroclitus]|uniref:C-C motif chemokine 18 n=1 Tax=Fundulus heteroclitus TaxID=8078 RepID=A0A3Q2QN79_FUNHE|nr:C-C motif chemokine 18 [Fundulus heteroclitus]